MSPGLSLLLSLLAAAPAPRTVELTAERVLRDGEKKRTTAEGAAQLVTDGAAVSADRIVYDEGLGAATAVGNVALRIVRPGLIAVTADAVSLRLEDQEVVEVFIHQGRAVRKKNTTPQALLAAATPEALDGTGLVSMTLTGSHLERDGDDWIADGVVFVPCDCDFNDPVWGIHAARARADFDAERVSLLSPTVRIKGVPVLWLPWISLPLTQRQTGLLVPKPGWSALNGFALEQPVFVTLGQSADLTFTPGYFFGGAGITGVQGPRLLTEFRYTPSWTTSGRVLFGFLYDLRAPRDPFEPNRTSPGMRGPRGELTVQHRQGLGRGWQVSADVAALSDGYYLRDVTADVVARESFYTRSTAAVLRRGQDVWVGLDVALRQDTAWGHALWGGETVLLPGAPAQGPNPLQRFPALTLAVAPTRLNDFLSWSLRAEFVRLAPLWGGTGDEGSTAAEGSARAQRADGSWVDLPVECVQQRVYWPYAPLPQICPEGVDSPDDRTEQGDRRWQPGERQGRDRVGVLPRLVGRLPLGDVATLSADAAWRQDLWLTEASGQWGTRGYPLLGARLHSELARTFGAGGDALRHVIAPVLEVRGAPAVVGAGLEPVPYDEADAAWPDRAGRLQAVAEIRQRLLSRSGTEVREHLRLDLGQGAELAGPQGARLAESWARLAAQAGPFRAQVSARVDFPRGRVTRLSATTALDGAPGGLYATWENLLDDGTDRTRQSIDLLFGPAAGPGNSRAQLVAFGGRTRLGGLGARYDALLLDRRYANPIATDPALKALTFVQHTLGLSYGPRCECWRVEVYATQRIAEAPVLQGPPTYLVPDFGASITLTGFGSFGTGG